MWRSSVIVGWVPLLAMLVTVHPWPIMGIGVGLAMAAGHNEANKNSTNGDNNVSSKTSR